MLKTTYLEGRSIQEKEVSFKELSDTIESYFLLGDAVKQVNINIEFSVTQGVSATFNNRIDIDNLYNCFKKVNDYILIEFEELKNAFTIHKDANIKLDFIHHRMYLLDSNITIYFR